jgi:hypothetical protein
MKLLGKIGVFSVLGITLSYGQPNPPSDVGDNKPIASTIQLAFPEMLAQTKAFHEQMLAEWQHIQHLREIARKDKDVIKLNCVNDKIVQVKPVMNLFDMARAALERSDGNDDRNTLFDDVSQQSTAIRKLREEADQCIGESTLASESESSFTAPDMPDNPFADPFDPIIEPPGYASPFN